MILFCYVGTSIIEGFQLGLLCKNIIRLGSVYITELFPSRTVQSSEDQIIL